jgi:hypothetical protein
VNNLFALSGHDSPNVVILEIKSESQTRPFPKPILFSGDSSVAFKQETALTTRRSFAVCALGLLFFLLSSSRNSTIASCGDYLMPLGVSSMHGNSDNDEPIGSHSTIPQCGQAPESTPGLSAPVQVNRVTLSLFAVQPSHALLFNLKCGKQWPVELWRDDQFLLSGLFRPPQVSLRS